VTYDVLIVGGGIMGSSTAFNLVRLEPQLKVAVAEKDSTYAKSSTTLSAANLRTVAFSLKENFLISKRTFEILETFESDMTVAGQKPSIYFRAEGNLFLCDAAGLAAARRIFTMHKSLGSNAEWLESDEIHARWPLLNVEGIAAGTFGPTDGHLDAYGLLMAYKSKARSMGVEYLQDEVVSLAAFVPAFESLKLIRGWAGLYEVNTLDHNAVIGPWPELEGFYLCKGFSGHGLMQGPAVGQYVAECITGRTPTLDLAVFTPARILARCQIGETGCF
jgi:glycine/D-amino acid oxidase-like deaminating enzyme